MIVEYIRYQIDEPRRGSVEAAYGAAQEVFRASPHCLGSEPARCAEDPGQYVLRIEWDSIEGHLQGLRRSPGFRTCFAAIGPYVDAIQGMRHDEPTTVRGEGGGYVDAPRG